MANVHDIAAYILARQGTMSTMKLQKLVYYSQAWHLAWEERLLFPERIEAWVNGPVAPALYDRHKGKFEISSWQGKPAELDPGEAESVDLVLDEYGRRSGQWLAAQTHTEPPWRDARRGLGPQDRSNREITPASMIEYYQSLPWTG